MIYYCNLAFHENRQNQSVNQSINQSINETINQSIKTKIFLFQIKRYSNIHYSATINFYLHICDKVSHQFTELLSGPIQLFHLICNTRTSCQICLKLKIKIPEQRQWR